MKTLRTTIEYAVVMLLLLLAVGGWYAYRQWSARGELIRQQILERVTRLAPHWQLEIESCSFDLLGRVRLENVSLRARDQAAAVATLPQLIVTFDTGAFLDSGQVEVTRIRLVRPRLDVSQDATGEWNWQQLLPLPELGYGSLPECGIDDGTVTIQRHDGLALAASHVTVSLVPSGKRRFSVRGSLTAEPAGTVAFDGQWDVDAATGTVDGEIAGLVLDRNLMQKVGQVSPSAGRHIVAGEQFVMERIARACRLSRPSPYAWASQQHSEGLGSAGHVGTDSSQAGMADQTSHPRDHNADRAAPIQDEDVSDARMPSPSLDVSAVGNVHFRITRQDPNVAPEYKLLIDLVRGNLRAAPLPYSANSVSGKLYCDNRRFILRDVSLGNGTTEFHVDGALSWNPSQQPSGFQVSVSNLTCDVWLRNQLSEGLQRIYDMLRPNGLMDVSVQLMRRETGEWKPGRLTVQVKEGSMTHTAFPYPIHAIHGTIVQNDRLVEINAQGLAGTQPVTIAGTVRDPGPGADSRFDVHVRGLPIDRNLLSACQPSLRATLESLKLQGSLDADLTLTKPPGLGQHFRQQLTVHVTGGSLEYDNFPYRIEELAGSAIFSGTTWNFQDVTGTHNGARLRASGVYTKALGTGELHLSIGAENAVLDESLRRALPASLQALWKQLNPAGRVDLNVGLDWQQDRPVTIAMDDVTIRDGRLDLVSFPYAVNQVQARCTYRDGLVEVTSLHGAHGDASISAVGSVRFDERGDWTTRFDELSVRDLVPDNEFRRALPPALRSVFECLNPNDPIAVSGMLELRGTQRPTDPLTAAWDLEAQFAGGTVTVGLDYEDVFGAVRASGIWNGYEVEVFDGRINLREAKVLGHRLTDVRGPFQVKGGMVVVGSRKSVLPSTERTAGQAIAPDQHVTARAIDGTITLDAVATLDDDPTYRVRLLLSNGKLERYAQLYMPGQTNLRGIMNGWIVMSGRGNDPSNVRGRGQLKIEPAALYELPVMAQILNVLSFAPPDRTAFRYALLDFGIANRQFQFDGIYLDGNTINLRGRGTAAFDGTLKLDFYSMLPRNQFPIPLINVVVREATRGWIGIEVRGTINAPAARTKPVPNLDETLKGFLNALPVLGPPVLPPPPPPSPSRPLRSPTAIRTP